MSTTKQRRKTATVTRNAASRSRERNVSAASGSGRALGEEERRRMIAEAAYYRAMRRGFAAGGEMDDWLAAEREINQR